MNNNGVTASGFAANPFINADLNPQKMSGRECFARFHQKLKATQNGALRNFNKLSDDFKFVVMTLANRHNPGTFKHDEIGQPFEYFDEERRVLIIHAMNEIARWGTLLPRRFSVHECVLPKD